MQGPNPRWARWLIQVEIWGGAAHVQGGKLAGAGGGLAAPTVDAKAGNGQSSHRERRATATVMHYSERYKLGSDDGVIDLPP